MTKSTKLLSDSARFLTCLLKAGRPPTLTSYNTEDTTIHVDAAYSLTFCSAFWQIIDSSSVCRLLSVNSELCTAEQFTLTLPEIILGGSEHDHFHTTVGRRKAYQDYPFVLPLASRRRSDSSGLRVSRLVPGVPQFVYTGSIRQRLGLFLGDLLQIIERVSHLLLTSKFERGGLSVS